MIVRIQRSQIHHFEEPIHDDNGDPTGEVRDILQLGISAVGVEHLPTYGIRVDITGITKKAEIKALLATEMKTLIAKIKAQMARDETIREYFNEWGWLEFDIDNL